MKIRVEVSGIEDVLERLSPERFAQAAEAALAAVVHKIEARAVRKAPHDTGNLIQQITSYVRGTTGVVGVTRAAPYAVYVHEGTGRYGPKKRPYEIRPREKKALFWPGAEHPVKKVKHPGIKPRPFLRDALLETDVAREFAKALGENL